MFIIETILEIAVGAFIIWGVFNEDKLVRFEDRIFAAVKRRHASCKKERSYRSTVPGDKHCA